MGPKRSAKGSKNLVLGGSEARIAIRSQHGPQIDPKWAPNWAPIGHVFRKQKPLLGTPTRTPGLLSGHDFPETKAPARNADSRRMAAVSSFWNPLGIILGSFSGRVGIILGSCWGHLGIILGSCWGHVGIILGSSWDNFGVMLGSSWDHFGVMSG